VAQKAEMYIEVQRPMYIEGQGGKNKYEKN
jgi:hypothetical protein